MIGSINGVRVVDFLAEQIFFNVSHRIMVKDQKLNNSYISLGWFMIAIGVAFLAAGGVSLITGKTIGLYGVIETRTSIFYWIFVITIIGLGVLAFIQGCKMLLNMN